MGHEKHSTPKNTTCMKKIKIMIAEDQTIMLNTLARELTTEGIEVVGKAKNGKELIDLIEKQIPDIVILDINMPVLDGLDTSKILAENYPSIKTIILSGEYSDYLASSVIFNGVAAFLDKGSDMAEVITAIEGVYKDGFYFNEIISRDILEQVKSSKKIYYLMDDKKFSEKEMEVFKEICKDLPPAIIADNLHIAESTFRFHKKNLLAKTESDTIVSLVKYAMRQGITK
jgi:DNA-binding NarL/FixJ family response regulator